MAAQGTSLDIISNLPSHIIESILCRVKLEEAARTSVLSKKWRYKWTKIPKLGFFEMFTYGESTDENEVPYSEETIESERKMMSKRCKVLYTIYQILLMRQGPIHEFALELEVDNTCFEIDHIINHLSRNKTVKDLHLFLSDKIHGGYYWIPLSIFSLQRLTHLSLEGCDLDLNPPFNGFRSLTNLYLKYVYIPPKTLLHLLSNCPLLKTFYMFLEWRRLIHDEKCTANELFKCLPMIESLTTWDWISQGFVVPPVSQELPVVSLIHLKYVYYTIMSKDSLYFLAFLMRCSPNVEKIEIEESSAGLSLYHICFLILTPKCTAPQEILSFLLQIFDDDDFCEKSMSFTAQAYSDTWLEHLNELKIANFSTEKPKLEFVRLILAKSPELKKVRLYFFNEGLDENDKSQMLGFLSSPPPVAEIILR